MGRAPQAVLSDQGTKNMGNKTRGTQKVSVVSIHLVEGLSKHAAVWPSTRVVSSHGKYISCDTLFG